MKSNFKSFFLLTHIFSIFIVSGCMPTRNQLLPSDPTGSGSEFNPIFSDSVCGVAANNLWEIEYQGTILATSAQYQFISGRALDCDEKIVGYDFEISCGAIAQTRYANCHVRTSSGGGADPRLDLNAANKCYENAKAFTESLGSPPCRP